MMSDLTIELGQMESVKLSNYYQRLLKDLHVFEANTENLSSILTNKLESLEFHVSYLFPFLDLHPRSLIATEKIFYEEWLQQDMGSVEVFFDNELRYLRQRMSGPFFFYARNYLNFLKYRWENEPGLYFLQEYRDQLECIESNHIVSTESTTAYDKALIKIIDILENDLKRPHELTLVEKVTDHLQYVELETNLRASANKFLREFEEGLNKLNGFGTLLRQYKFLELVVSLERRSHIFYVTKLLPVKVRYMFYKFKKFGDKTVFQEIGYYLDTIKSAQLQASMVYLVALKNLGPSQAETCCFKYETLCFFIDYLQNIFKRLVDDFPYRRSLLQRILDNPMELEFIRSVVKCVLAESLEDRGWIVDAISTHIDVLAADVIDALDKDAAAINFISLQKPELKHARQKISGVRNIMRKIKNTGTSVSCVDEFLKNFMLLVRDSVLTCPTTKNQLRDLELLHTLLQNSEKIFRVNQELTDMCQFIERGFRDGLWDLRSHLLRRCRKHCPVFLAELTSEMPKANDFLVTLINFISSMLVNVESDATMIVTVKHYAKKFIQEVSILRCIHINLQTQYWEEEESANLSQDIKVVATEAMSTYSLLLKGLDGNIQSSMVETLECFNASVRRAYLKFLKLPPSDVIVSNSEVMFHEMLGYLKEFKESGVAEWTEHQLGVLYDSLGVCRSFLSPHIFNKGPEELMHSLRKQIMKMGCRVENLIFAFEIIPEWFIEMWLFDLINEVKVIKEEVSRLSIMATTKIEAELSHAKAQKETNAREAKAGLGDEHNHPAKTQEVILSFEVQENQLSSQLTIGRQQRQVISIVGMPGIGKTTLALNVYNSCANSFHATAWCYVSQDFQRKELLQNIITQIEKPSSNQGGEEENDLANKLKPRGEEEEDLANELKKILLTKRNYLIVLDDVWDINAWNALKQCFPAGNNRSRILVTSRYKTVALELNCDKSSCLELGLLDADNSWRLLLKRVFGARICPPRLHEVGKVIANRCDGLPLSIVVIAGILKNTEMTADKWNEVAESLESHFVIDQNWVSKLELSYNQLSISLKKCFLYCGALVKGREIRRSKLVQLWCAERFCDDYHQQQSQERVLEMYISDLVDRSLLMVAKTGFDNRIQTCRIHDLLGDFAIQKATEDKFLVSTNRCTHFTSLQRRLCLTRFPFGDGASDSSVATKSLARSLFINADLSKNDIPVPDTVAVARFFGHFKSLFVLDLENVELRFSVDNGFQKAVGDMKSLRYFAIQSKSFRRIPSSFGQLLNLETLIIRSLFSGTEVPDFIFNFKRLRHLHLSNARCDDSKRTNSPCNSLQSFGILDLDKHTGDWLFARLPNLVKLSCKFNHCKSIDFSILTCLESLKVQYMPYKLYSHKLSFPSSLRKLMLSSLSIPSYELDRIAPLLPQLEKLKLLGVEFDRDTWNTSSTFQKLKLFRLDDVYIRTWNASEDSFPSLERLILRRCRQLVSIPKAFGKGVLLKGIEIYECDPSVAKLAMKIKKMQIGDGNMLFEAIVPGYDDEDDDSDYADSDDDDD